MKRILTGLMLLCLSLPIGAEEGPQQKSLDQLLSNIEQRQIERATDVSPEEQIQRLKSQLIDIKVQRDLLNEQNQYLRKQIEDMNKTKNRDVVCPPGKCISAEDARRAQILQHVLYTLSLYRLAEYMDSVIPEEDVEAHTKAHRIMESAKADLEFLGFDTSNPEDFPTLEELLEQSQINRAHTNNEAHDNTSPRTN